MQTFIQIKYNKETGEVVCKFDDKFTQLSKDDQLDIAREVANRMGNLISSLEAIIARSPSSNS